MKFSILPRLYFNKNIITSQTLTLSDEPFHYCKSVLRMKIHEEFRLFNERDGEFKVKINQVNRHDLQIQVLEQLRLPFILPELTLALCIIKPDRFTEAIKACTQLGITKIVPVISERSQFKAINDERINRCIIESTEQSERLSPPLLYKPLKLSEFLNMNGIDQIILANEEEKAENKLNVIEVFGKSIAALIGPEGGFTNHESIMLNQNNKVNSISLGDTVLRSEVAAISLISLIKILR